MTEQTESDARQAKTATQGGLDVHRRALLAIGAAGALGAGLGPGIASVAAQDDSGDGAGLYLAAATGDQQPEPIDTDATGGAMFSVNEEQSEMEYALLAHAIENVNQAHIHLGPEGENGPVAVWLYPGPDATEPELQEGRFDGVLATGTITEDHLTEEVEGQSMDALLEEIANGNAYVNIHTEANPGGEIRGQLLAVEDVVSELIDDDGGDTGSDDDGDDSGNTSSGGDGDDNSDDNYGNDTDHDDGNSDHDGNGDDGR